MIERLNAKEPMRRVELHHHYQQQHASEETTNYKLPESTKQTNGNSNPMKSNKMMSLRSVRLSAQEATKEQRDSFAATTNNNHDDSTTRVEFKEAFEAPQDPDQEQQQSATQQADFKDRLKNIVIALLAKKKETKMDNLEAMINESALKLLQQKELVFKQASCLQLDQLCKTTKFNRRELKWLYLGWKVACTDGCGQNTDAMGGSDNSYGSCFSSSAYYGIINEQQFQQIYAQFFPYGGDCSFYAKYVFQAMFSETLVENGGFITFADYAHALSQLLRGTIDEKIDFVFKLYDLNNDNVITLDELSRIFFAVYRLLGDNVNMKHDQLTYEQQAERLYNKIDSDQSGQITRQQFVAYCKRDSTIVDTIQSLEMSICSNA